jgi:hypothetical protein
VKAATTKKSEADELTTDELGAIGKDSILIPGRPYLFVMGFGWAIVAYFVCRLDPFTIKVAHANHFRNAGVDYGKFIHGGASATTEWRYEGTTELSVGAIQRKTLYHGKVPRGTLDR